MTRRIRFICSLLAVLCLGVQLHAQATTGTLTGVVTMDSVPLPGVSVTIASPALQGTRNTYTNENGAYNFPALPPGEYAITFELEGMDSVSKTASVSLVQTARADAAMGVTTVAEAITVTASAPSALETTAVSTNFSAETVENLPVTRDLLGAQSLAPGVSTEGAASGSLVISGAPSYNNLYLVNGAVVNDTNRGQPESVFIEDAIQETTILTGNVSAEYGRFTGGVISAITKSGGNEFSGSYRANATNDDWTNKTPFAGEADHLSKTNFVHEATLGGRIVRDRLWFFAAGRQAEISSSRETLGTHIPFTYSREDERYEGKLTGQITSKHSVVGSYLDREIFESNQSFGSIVDIESLDDRTLPNTLTAITYNGLMTSNFFIEAQWSAREFAFEGSGANFTDRIYGTLIRDFGTQRRGWSPTFCGVCDDETRDNEYLQLKGSYFLSTAGAGNHNIVIGAEDFSEQRFANNYQSGSNYRVWGDFLYNADKVWLHVFPSNGNVSEASWIQWTPIFEESQKNDTNTKSIYFNDKWDLNSKWSFNVGLRYDRNDAEDQAGHKQSNDSGFSPRIGATYDVRGDGRHRISAGYNRYVSSIDNGVVDNASTAGSPATYLYDYNGPEINPLGCETAGTCVPTDVVLEQVFNWYDANVNQETDFWYAYLPGINTRIDGRLESPYMDEVSIGYGAQIGTRGFVRADYIDRSWKNFYVNVTNLGTGKVTDALGNEFDLTMIQNSSDALTREYGALMVQGNYRILDRLALGGNYTYANLTGNSISETAAQGTVTLTSADSYPEYLDIAWNNPKRDLDSDVKHSVNLWLSYDQPLGRFGNLNLSLLERYHTGFPYYAMGAISLAMIENPGYENPPSFAWHFLEGSKEYRTEDVSRTDLGVNYGIPIGSAEIFVQADILNMFDEAAVEDPDGVNQTIYTSRNSQCLQGSNGPSPGTRCLAFNPFTEQPVEGVHWQKGPSFGQATSTGAYQLPLTYRFSVGVRF